MRTPDNPPFIVRYYFAFENLVFKLFSVLKHIIFYELIELWGGATSISDGIFYYVKTSYIVILHVEIILVSVCKY